MAISEIPLRSDTPDFKFTIQLGTRFYVLRFLWNTRTSTWSLDIYTQDEEPILLGQRIFVGFLGFKRFKDLRLPEGRIYFYDTSGKSIDPGRTDLGDRVQMFYEDPE